MSNSLLSGVAGYLKEMKEANGSSDEGIYHYDQDSEVPTEIKKYAFLRYVTAKTLLRFTRYWHQRYRIFSKFDDGIWMTNDAWFGVTPEPVAT